MKNNIYNFVYLNRNSVPKHICEDVIEESENPNYHPWDKHRWSYKDNDPDAGSRSLELDPDVNNLVGDLFKYNQILRDHIIKNMVHYAKINTAIPPAADRINELRLNRYKVGNELAIHVDNIRSIFDGTKKGVPILSIIVNLNDQYTGGEIVFNREKTISLGTGDILIFPSNFLYAHEIKPILSGTRYSIVAWGY